MLWSLQLGGQGGPPAALQKGVNAADGFQGPDSLLRSPFPAFQSSCFTEMSRRYCWFSQIFWRRKQIKGTTQLAVEGETTKRGCGAWTVPQRMHSAACKEWPRTTAKQQTVCYILRRFYVLLSLLWKMGHSQINPMNHKATPSFYSKQQTWEGQKRGENCFFHWEALL